VHNNLWQAVLGEIELSISRGNFITWFKNTTVLRQDDKSITIGVPNVFIKQHIERKYNTLITGAPLLKKSKSYSLPHRQTLKQAGGPQRVKLHPGPAP
jgi:chromosomal replication initiation ATPase DnaA